MEEEKQTQQTEEAQQQEHPAGKKKKGFWAQLAWLLTALIIIAAGGFASWYILQINNDLESEIDSTIVQDYERQFFRSIKTISEETEEAPAAWQRADFGTFSMEYPTQWNVAVDEALLSDESVLGLDLNYKRLYAFNRTPVYFSEIYEFSYPWDVTMVEYKDEYDAEEILERIKASFEDVEEEVESLEGITVHRVTGQILSPGETEREDTEYVLIVEEGEQAESVFSIQAKPRFGYEDEETYEQVRNQLARMIESLRQETEPAGSNE